MSNKCPKQINNNTQYCYAKTSDFKKTIQRRIKKIDWVNYYYKQVNGQDFHLILYTNGETRLIDDSELYYLKAQGVSI